MSKKTAYEAYLEIMAEVPDHPDDARVPPAVDAKKEVRRLVAEKYERDRERNDG